MRLADRQVFEYADHVVDHAGSRRRWCDGWNGRIRAGPLSVDTALDGMPLPVDDLWGSKTSSP
jgi:hypothetical protein